MNGFLNLILDLTRSWAELKAPYGRFHLLSLRSLLPVDYDPSPLDKERGDLDLTRSWAAPVAPGVVTVGIRVRPLGAPLIAARLITDPSPLDKERGDSERTPPDERGD